MKPLIVIVEDELIIALDLKEILENEGYECIMNITSVEEAIAIIENRNPVLVLIDINLKKDKDGVALGEYLLKRDTIPFVYVTSHSDKTTLSRAQETRPYGYIIKPFKPSDLLATVYIVLNNHLHRNIDIVRTQQGITDDVPFIIKKVIAYINDNLHDKINASDLVKHTRWDSQHFSRLFTKYVGVTPIKYIMMRRIDKAKILLSETTVPITQISFELAFKSHSNFCTVFKRMTNCTPENYRKQNEINSKYLV